MVTNHFSIRKDIHRRAPRDEAAGVRITVSPRVLVEMMDRADAALNSGSADAARAALDNLREWMSDLFEDPEARIREG